MTVVNLNTEAFGACRTPDEFRIKAFKLLGPALEKVKVFGNQVLVLTYIPPSITKGGIHLTSTMEQESRFQGLSALVLKKGPAAFVDNHLNKFHGSDVSPGDWAWFWFRDAWEFSIDKYSVRLISDALIRGVTDDPLIFETK